MLCYVLLLLHYTSEAIIERFTLQLTASVTTSFQVLSCENHVSPDVVLLNACDKLKDDVFFQTSLFDLL